MTYNYEFVSINEPSEELIREFHRGMAKALIENYGAETMREVVRQYKEMHKLDE